MRFRAVRHLLATFAATTALAGAARAADKPIIAPAPAWVVPVAIPASQGAADEAPVRLLLQDQQVALERGRQTNYSQTVVKIEAPQGLAAGNISLAWRPDTDVLTVHKLLIRRGDQVIDVLASGQTFTVVRRETNLESAMLDGVLTANIQPEGLQVGDIVDFAASVTSSDPVMSGHVEAIAGGWNGVPIGRAHLRMQWPSTFAVRFRQTADLPALKVAKAGALTSVELSLDDLRPVVLPKGAPLRYALARIVEATDFTSWADLVALMAPLYRKAAVLPAQGPLRTEADRIRALSPDPKVRAEAVLALVQDRVRYVALAMGAGGLVPADAETSWSRRYGDCKAKTALLLALLHAQGIEAEPVLVSTLFGDGLDARLPTAGLFNHVLVRAKVAGRTYWLDGTRAGDTSLDRLDVPAFRWGLPLIERGASLVRMMPGPLEAPREVVTIRLDARAGLTVPAPARIETLFRGDDALASKAWLSNLSGQTRESALRDYWKGQYDFIDVQKVDAIFDPKTGEHRLTMTGLARMDWSAGWYETDGTGIGYKADFSRDPGPNRDAPFAVNHPYSKKLVETILLPPGFSQQSGSVGRDVNRTLAGIAYSRHATLADNVFTIERTERSVAVEFPASEAPTAQAALRELAEEAVYIRKPTAYRPTEAEVSAALATTPQTAAAYVVRGNMLLDRARYAEAAADFDRAHALDPKDPWALANRGIARVWQDEFDNAASDLDAAQAIDPRNPVVFRARGLMAEKKGDDRGAVAAYTTALEIEPGSSFALIHRAQTHRADGNDDAALADAAALLKIQPAMVDMHVFRANIFRSRGKREEALAEAAAVAVAAPGDSYAHVASAKIYSAFGKQAEAMRAYDRAIALKPEAYIYVNRSQDCPGTDLAGRRADIEAALKLEPDLAEAIEAKAKLLADAKDFAGAALTYSAALGKAPNDPVLRNGRGIAYARGGDTMRADADFAAARAKATEAEQLNAMCWSKATAGVGLASALLDCDAALAKAPDRAAYLDSRALVLLRLGRLDDALRDYDRALAKAPRQTSSLYGRAVARARKGDKAGSAIDADAAIKADPDVRTRFERYGVTI